MKNSVVEVYANPLTVDVGLLKSITDLYIKGIIQVYRIQLYRVEGDFTYPGLECLAEKLLVDPVTQKFQVQSTMSNVQRPTSKNQPLKSSIVNRQSSINIEVWFKKGVTDAVGDSVVKASYDLGIKSIQTVNTGVKYIFSGTHINKQLIIQVCERLLVNQIIQEYKFIV